MDELSVSLSIHFCVQFIKPQNYENTKSKKFKNNIGKRENQNLDIFWKLKYMNVKIVMTVLLNQNVQKQRVIKGYKYLLYL